jgi:hypothetical protein
VEWSKLVQEHVREFKVEVIEKASKPEAGMVGVWESLSDVSVNGKVESWGRM